MAGGFEQLVVQGHKFAVPLHTLQVCVTLRYFQIVQFTLVQHSLRKLQKVNLAT